MENEKKNASPEGGSRPHKKHHHRRRGYFIEPPKSEGSTPAVTHSAPSSAPAPEAQKTKKPEGGEPRKDGQKNASRHRNRRGNKHGGGASHNNQPQKNGQAAENTNKNATPNSQKSAAEKTAANDSRTIDHGGKNRSKHSSNHNRKPTNDKLIPTESKPVAPSVPENNEWEYEEVSFPATEERADTAEAVSEEPTPMVEVVGVRFKNSGKTYYFAPLKYPVKRGDFVIVETARGPEYGEVTMGNSMVKRQKFFFLKRPRE